MNKNYIEKLLEGVDSSAGSLQGVEWKALGEVCIRTKGTKITASQMKILHKENAPLKIFAGGKTVAFVAFDDIPEKDINREPSIIIKSRGNIEFEYYDQPFSHKNEMWSYHSKNENINIKFVYYFLKIHESYFQNIGARMQMPQISIPDTEKFKIPIPPLSVQKEIVRILDTFTELTAELTTELTARKQQYNFYREELLSFEMENEKLKIENENNSQLSTFNSQLNKVEWKTLGEIGVFQRGKRFVKDDLISQGVPTIHYGEMYTHYGTWADQTKSFVSEELVAKKNLRIAEKGDVVIVAAGETIEDLGKGTAWLADEGVVVHDACFSFRSPINSKYFAYFTRTRKYHDQIRRHISSGKISAINSRGLGKVIIPIPSEEEQERIVSILDKFDTLTTSISEGLPKEIELRQKQYEYYRDRLLTFDITKK